VKKYSSFFFITIVFLIAFAPIASFVFALKNDFFLGYFPPKFLLSETVTSGQLPLWNPYISFGLPFYADMNGAYWNPVTWIIALTTGYSAYTLTVELLLYILCGGAGMYMLTKHFTDNNSVRLVAAIAFMCNGFVIGHLQHLNWISGSAFLPWCIWGVYNILKNGSLRNILVTTLAFYLLISASHPGMIIGSIYFFFGLLIFLLYLKYKESGWQDVKKGVYRLFVLFALLLALSSGLIAGYVDILPHFARNTKVDLHLSLVQNTNLQSWISLFAPFSTVKDNAFFRNDIALRNNYIGLTLLCFLLLSFITKKTKQQSFFLATGLLFLLLSLGGNIKLFAHNYIPLIGYVRINGEFRIFAIICFILAAVISFDYFSANKTLVQKNLKRVSSLIVVALISLLLVAMGLILQGHTAFHNSIASEHTNWRETIKLLIDQLEFGDVAVLQCLIQIPLLLMLRMAILNMNFNRILILTVADLIIATSLNLPFTGVGKVSVGQIAAIHEQSPRGIPVPKLEPLRLHDTIPNKDSALVGDWSFYNKQIGKSRSVLYPVKLSANYQFYQLLKRDSSLSVANHPFLFLSKSIDQPKLINNQSLEQANILDFSTNHLKLRFDANDSGFLVLLQNFYPHWTYKKNNQIAPVQKAGINFIAVPVTKGENNIEITFSPPIIKILLLFCAILLLLIVIVAGTERSKQILFP
jgi:hypothetical protein